MGGIKEGLYDASDRYRDTTAANNVSDYLLFRRKKQSSAYNSTVFLKICSFILDGHFSVE